MTDMTDVGGFFQRMDSLLKERGLTYKAFSEICGFNKSSLYNLKSRGRYPSPENIFTIADKLDTSIDWLVYGDSHRTFGIPKGEAEAVTQYLTAPKAVRDIVNRIIKGQDT